MKNYIIEKDEISGNDFVYGYESYFDKQVVIAYISHDIKEIRPQHGYFAPHPHSKYSIKLAKKLGYVFNNN